MTINFEDNTIEMTKTEAKLAGKVGSEEFRQLKELRADFPGFKIVVKSAPKSKDHLKGLTVAYMKTYIEAHDNEEKSIMKEFHQLRGLDENGKPIELAFVASYGELKMWFLDQYPEIENLNSTVNNIIARSKKSREAKRQAAKQAA